MTENAVRDTLVPIVWWTFGKGVLGSLTRVVARLKVYGAERVPREGGAILACNHFAYLDAAAFGTACPRRIVYVAKEELHQTRGLGPLIRSHGTLALRRGESDRDALRRMRETVRGNELLGMFIEGTRQKSGTPGEARPGVAMVAMREGVPIVPAAVHGSLDWNWNFKPVSVAFGEPMRFETYPWSSAGYRQAAGEVMSEIRRLWAFLADMHELGRPDGVPPARLHVPSRAPE